MGCASQAKETYQERLTNTGKPARHAVTGERLAVLMKRLEALMFERQQTQVEIDENRRAYLEETKTVARDLLETTTYIADAADDLELNQEDRGLFMALNTKLERQVRVLAVLADQGSADALQAQYDEITTTCNACHSNFRDMEKIDL